MTRRALVTGSSGGIGRAVCERLVAQGWVVTGIDVVDPQAPASWDHRSCDLAEPSAGPAAVANIGLDPPIAALVHAAAVQPVAVAGRLSVAEWMRTLQVNLVALDELVGACEAQLRQSHGAVVAVSSVHAFVTTRAMAAYAASKAALTGWVRAAALDLAPEVRVNAVAPGAILTPMLEAGFARRPAEGGQQESLRLLAERTPLGVVAGPAAVAAMIATLVDPELSGYMTGTTVTMDGGASIRLSTE